MTKVLTVNDVSRFSITPVLNDKFIRVEKQLFRVRGEGRGGGLSDRSSDKWPGKNNRTRAVYTPKFLLFFFSSVIFLYFYLSSYLFVSKCFITLFEYLFFFFGFHSSPTSGRLSIRSQWVCESGYDILKFYFHQ